MIYHVRVQTLGGQAELEAARMGYRPSPPPADPTAGAAATAPAGAGRYGLSGPALGAHAASGAGARPRMSLDLARLQPSDTASPSGQARRACLAAPVVRTCMTRCVWPVRTSQRPCDESQAADLRQHVESMRACMAVCRCSTGGAKALARQQGLFLLPQTQRELAYPCAAARVARFVEQLHWRLSRRADHLRDRAVAVSGDARTRAVTHTLANSAGPSAAQRRAGGRRLCAAAYRERPLAHAAARVWVAHPQARCAAALLCLAQHAAPSNRCLASGHDIAAAGSADWHIRYRLSHRIHAPWTD